jgi:large subunit ribosomal protein L25
MSIIASKLEAKSRTGSGKSSARQSRRDGLVPAIVYGPHLENPISISVHADGVKAAIATPKKLNSVIGLSVDGTEHMVLLKDYQMDPVSRALLHADFIAVKETETVKVKIPLVLTGKSIGVLEGGILSQMRRELEVWSLPGAIPEKIEIDVTGLKIAMALHINDVKLPAGVNVKTHQNFTICVVTAPEVEKVAEPTAASAAAPADGKAAPAADGKAAPAADGKAAPAAAKAPAAKK